MQISLYRFYYTDFNIQIPFYRFNYLYFIVSILLYTIYPTVDKAKKGYK